MHNNRPHHLLEQVPLTVSPFVSLPTATTLSYNYKTMPSNIPPSTMGIPTASEDQSQQPKPRFVVSGSGHAAHPDEIAESCQALLDHVTKSQENAERELCEFEERIKQRELAEKRRLAPGWLDSESRLLQPEKKSGQVAPSVGIAQQQEQQQQPLQLGERRPQPLVDPGVELDRAFGGMALK
ncbi:hypothetical protein NOR_05192 [Metarhizium rileyi]|uniref:Uncharacterized protein n=1 Tax=Metarhizium rileyi (strain RCEF 4871) TaxID=1649241 RepID=A0A167CX68_METRR|nr:hypothetical protein NOR_05192 [Metarhizium rileyi RCEF 4871]